MTTFGILSDPFAVLLAAVQYSGLYHELQGPIIS